MTSTDWIQFGAAMVYKHRHQYEAAEKIFNQVLSLNPSYAEAYVQLGLIRMIQGRKSEAEDLFETAVSHDPLNETGHYQSGLLKLQRADFDAAKIHFSKILEIKPLHAEAMLNLGCTLGHKGDFKEAERFIRAAYSNDRHQIDGFARLGWIKSEQTDWDGAFEIMKRDLEENRISPGWKVNLAQIYARKGRWEDADALIEEAYAADPALTDGFARLGWIKTEDQKWRDALDLMHRDLENGKISCEWRGHLAMVQALNGNLCDAIASVNAWYAEDKNATDGYARVGWAYYLISRDKDKLEEMIAKDLRQNRLSAGGRKLKGLSISLQGYLTSAVNAMDDLYRENTWIKDAFAMLGWIQIERGATAEGLALMEKEYQLKRMTPIWQTNYVYQLAKAGQNEKAQTLFKEAMQSDPHRKVFRIGYQFIPLAIMTKNQMLRLIEH